MRVARRSAIAALVAYLAFGALSTESQAAGKTFQVVNCNSLNRAFGGVIETTNAFTARNDCNDPASDLAVKIQNVARASEGRSARAIWEAPAHLGIVGVSVEARLRRADGFKSQLLVADAQGRFVESVASGDRDPSPFRRFEWSGQPQRSFVATLECTNGPSCDPSEQAKTWVRDLTFTVADFSDPEIEVDGSLFEGGWLREASVANLRSADTGSGIRHLTVSVNGEPAGEELTQCAGSLSGGVATQFAPCPTAASYTADLDVGSTPFIGGSNQISICGVDFASNERCELRTVRVDTLEPTVAFSNFQSETDPELIRALVDDAHSGARIGSLSYRQAGSSEWRSLPTALAAGELQARVDSSSEEPGTYEFRATASDVAGNSAETTVREDGTPMTLEFPLRSGVDLNSHIEPGGSKLTTLRYGKNARAEGRLVDAAGNPMPDQLVVVDEHFGDGALIDHRTRTVVTDEEGRFRSKLPAGPSRSVSASYAGDQRYLAAVSEAGRMAVKTGARLGVTRKRVPEGRGTKFRGRIKRLGARIPARGKLLQLQYQDPTSGRWSTVRNPFHTKSNGRFKFRYGFGTHYEVDVAIRFRLKVPSERGWPYRGTHTRGRRVIVQAR